jgi:Zn-dependent protease with chaperone function
MKYFSIVLLLLTLNSFAAPEDSVQYYIDNYGRANTTDKLVRRVHKIFNKLKLVADKRHHRLPKLVIVKDVNSPYALAAALPDGYIVLSKHAVNIFYKNVSLIEGDTRAAFVLGHELAHLANDDFWHREFFCKINHFIINIMNLCPNIKKIYYENYAKQKELKADNQGFIYAAMAGYSVDKLLAKGNNQQNFFKSWEQQGFRTDKTHPTPEERANQLQTRLQALLEIIPYFKFGVRLSHFDSCNDAIYFLREFAKHFPAREVYNNLGICELQMARKALGKDAYTYWLPFVLDATTSLENLPYGSRGDAATLAMPFLENAKEYFKLALEMEPSYIAANVNLAITTLYMGEIYQARVAIEKAHKLAPLNLEIQAIRTVILYQEGKQSPYVDMWPYVMRQLEKLMQETNASLSVQYNIARLLEQRKRNRAKKFWQKLAKQALKLPAPIRDIVCKKTNCRQQQQRHNSKKWKLPINLGVETYNNKTLHKWQKNQLRLYDLYEQIYQDPKDSVSILALREVVEMVVLKKINIKINQLQSSCTQELTQRSLVNGKLLSCGNFWAGLIVDNKVKEVWVHRQPES